MKKYVSVWFLLFAFLLARSVANAQLKPQRVRVSAKVTERLVQKRVAPDYPQEAKDKHLEGSVVLTVMVDKRGNVTDAKLFSGEPIFAPAAIDAVKKWKYKPYLLNGEAVEVETTIQVNFVLTH